MHGEHRAEFPGMDRGSEESFRISSGKTGTAVWFLLRYRHGIWVRTASADSAYQKKAVQK